MYYEKLLGLYNLPEDCFTLFPGECPVIYKENSSKEIALNIMATDSVALNEKTIEPLHNDLDSPYDKIVQDMSRNWSNVERVDCNDCEFLESTGCDTGEKDNYCRIKKEYLPSTDVSCTQFEQKGEISSEPDMDDYSG